MSTKKDYLGMYRKFQAGGAAPAPEAAPAPADGGAGQMEQVLMEVVQTQNPQLALEFCNMLAEQMGMTGQAAPAPTAPAEGAPVPVARRGMRLQPRFKSNGTL